MTAAVHKACEVLVIQQVNFVYRLSEVQLKVDSVRSVDVATAKESGELKPMYSNVGYTDRSVMKNARCSIGRYIRD